MIFFGYVIHICLTKYVIDSNELILFKRYIRKVKYIEQRRCLENTHAKENILATFRNYNHNCYPLIDHHNISVVIFP